MRAAFTIRLPNLVASVTFSRRSLMALPARGRQEGRCGVAVFP